MNNSTLENEVISEPDKFWLNIPFDDKDIRYTNRRDAQQALIGMGEGGYIMKSVAYVTKPQIRDIK